jgi:tetratricopeptide (TPR) repeat protein/predicted  nucleic acid-binding Zn-ribbon protein
VNKHRWFEVLEYLALVGAGFGTVASVVYQQAALASTPVSIALALNMVNRRRLDQQLHQGLAPALDHLDQEVAQEIQALQAVQQQLLAMPQPDHFSSHLDTVRQEAMQQTQQALSQLKVDFHGRLAALETTGIQPIQQEVTQLRDRVATLQTSLLEVNTHLLDTAIPDRITHLDTTLVKVVAMLGEHQRSLQDLATQSSPELAIIQEQVQRLQRQFASLPEPVDRQGLEQDIALLRQEVDSLLKSSLPPISRQELAATASELAVLRQAQNELHDRVVPLVEATTTMQQQMETLAQAFATRPDTRSIEALRQGLVKLFHRCEAVRQQVNTLVEAGPPQDIAYMQATITSLQADVATIQTTLAELGTKLDTKLDTPQPVQVEQLAQRLTDLEGNVQLLQVQLQQATQQVPEPVPEPVPQQDLEQASEQVLGREETFPRSVVEVALVSNGTSAALPSQKTLQVEGAVVVAAPSSLSIAVADGTMVPRSPHHLLNALTTAEEQVLIVGNWFGVQGFDEQLRRQMQAALNRGVCVVIDCVSLVEPEDVYFPRRIQHQEEATHPRHEFVQMLQNLLELQHTYPNQLSLRVLGLQEWFLICDRQYVILPPACRWQAWEERGLLSQSPSQPVLHSSVLQNSGLNSGLNVAAIHIESDHIRSTDPVLLQALVDQLDYPALGLATAMAYFTRAAIHYELGNSEAAVTDYADALQLNHYDALAYNNRGLIYYELGDFRRSIADFNQAIALEPDNATIYANRGTVLAEIGEYQGAIADYTSSLERCPTDNTTYNNRGLLYSRVGDRQRAIADYTAAIHLKPNDYIAYFNRGAARASLGDYTGAIVDYSQAIHIHPYFANAYNNRGFAQQKLGERAAALADFTQAIRINPGFANAYNNRGITRSKLGDFQGAIADFDQGIRINPEFANAYNNRGTVLSKLGDITGALADFDRAVELNPEFANAYNNRGLAYAELGNIELATDDLMQAARLFQRQGDEASSQQALQKLKSLQQVRAEIGRL